MIRPHEAESKKVNDPEARARYEAYIDVCISEHDFDDKSELFVEDMIAVSLVDRNAVLDKYAESYKIDGHNGSAPGWRVTRMNSGVMFGHPTTR